MDTDTWLTRLSFVWRSQSKLSQEQLLELQKSTHFDKKELQQWYKGKFGRPPPNRFPSCLKTDEATISRRAKAIPADDIR